MKRPFRIGLVLLSIFLLASLAAAEPQLESLRGECLERVQTIKEEIQQNRFWNAWITVIGALIAALGSTLAGFTSKVQYRKISAVCGGLGALLAITPKLLPDPSQLQELLFAIDNHLLPGEKVYFQLKDLNDPSYIIQCHQYATSRYLECARSVNPKREVPPIPMPVSLVEAPGAGKGHTVIAVQPDVRVRPVQPEPITRGVVQDPNPGPPVESGAFLLVKSAPPFAALTINDKPQGETPMNTYLEVPIGKCHVEIVHRSSPPFDTVITITPGFRREFRFKLDR